MILNLNAPPVDNETDDILVKSANGDMGTTSKAAIIAAGRTQDLQSVLENGSEGSVSTDITLTHGTGTGRASMGLSDGNAMLEAGETSPNQLIIYPTTAELTSNLKIGASVNDEDAIQRQEVSGLISENSVPIWGTTEENPFTGDINVADDGETHGFRNTNGTFVGINEGGSPIISQSFGGVYGSIGASPADVSVTANNASGIGVSLRTTNLTTQKIFEFPDTAGTIALKEYVDDADDLKANLSGAVFTGDVQVLTMPTNADSATSKTYVDNLVTGLSWKFSAKASTVSALPTYTVSGSNTILTATSNGALTLDGVTLVANDRVLIKNETTTNRVNNGIYSVTQVGSAGTPYILTRTQDANTSSELDAATVYVREGSTELNRIYAVNVSPITLGTTQITFSLINGGGTYTNGSGLTLTGNVFAIDPAYTSARAAYADAKVANDMTTSTSVAPSKAAVIAYAQPLLAGSNNNIVFADGSNSSGTTYVQGRQIGTNNGDGSQLASTTAQRKAFWDLQMQINAMPLPIVNDTSTAFTKATLNSTYPTAIAGVRIICKNVGSGMIYTKASGTDWLSTSAVLMT